MSMPGIPPGGIMPISQAFRQALHRLEALIPGAIPGVPAPLWHTPGVSSPVAPSAPGNSAFGRGHHTLSKSAPGFRHY